MVLAFSLRMTRGSRQEALTTVCNSRPGYGDPFRRMTCLQALPQASVGIYSRGLDSPTEFSLAGGFPPMSARSGPSK
jgi:hypothetical protein